MLNGRSRVDAWGLARAKEFFNALALWSALACAASCTHPPYYLLAGAYPADDAAAKKLGLCIHFADGVVVEPYQIFKADRVAAQEFSGSKSVRKDIAAAMSLSVRSKIKSTCTAEANSLLGVLSLDETHIKFSSALESITSDWMFEAAQDCCLADGKVAPQCKVFGVIVSMYKTSLDYKKELSKGIGSRGNLVCSDAVSGSFSMGFVSSSQFFIKSDGWNVAKLQSIEDVCSRWTKLQRFICEDGKPLMKSRAECPADHDMAKNADGCCGPKLSCKQDEQIVDHACVSCPKNFCAKPGANRCEDFAHLRAICTGNRILDLEHCDCRAPLACPQVTRSNFTQDGGRCLSIAGDWHGLIEPPRNGNIRLKIKRNGEILGTIRYGDLVESTIQGTIDEFGKLNGNIRYAEKNITMMDGVLSRKSENLLAGELTYYDEQGVRRLSAPIRLWSGYGPTKPPEIVLFASNQSSIFQGQSVTLSWDVTEADVVRIEPDIGVVAGAGTKPVAPGQSADYMLKAFNARGTSEKSIHIDVTAVSALSCQIKDWAACAAFIDLAGQRMSMCKNFDSLAKSDAIITVERFCKNSGYSLPVDSTRLCAPSNPWITDEMRILAFQRGCHQYQAQVRDVKMAFDRIKREPTSTEAFQQFITVLGDLH